MTGKKLRHGYTTGACAAAAAKGAALCLRDRQKPDEVVLTLPAGETARFRLQGCELHEGRAACSVVKDAGDDPDVTNGAEIRAEITVVPGNSHRVVIQGGTGVGRVTKPGLAVPVGEWAINPVPRRMILDAVTELLAGYAGTVTVTVSIPAGEELAKKTLNTRLGIIGGLSILGTTGIVKPVSARAWTDTIDTAIDVALACGSRTIVLCTGRTSELAAQNHFGRSTPLAEEAFVMMGDHVGYALRACLRKGVGEVVLAGQFAKLLKIACGHEQTHVTSSELDLQQLRFWLDEAGCASVVPVPWDQINTARQVLEQSGNAPALAELVRSRAAGAAGRMAPGLAVTVLLAGYNGEVL